MRDTGEYGGVSGGKVRDHVLRVAWDCSWHIRQILWHKIGKYRNKYGVFGEFATCSGRIPCRVMIKFVCCESHPYFNLDQTICPYNFVRPKTSCVSDQHKISQCSPTKPGLGLSVTACSSLATTGYSWTTGCFTRLVFAQFCVLKHTFDRQGLRLTSLGVSGYSWTQGHFTVSNYSPLTQGLQYYTTGCVFLMWTPLNYPSTKHFLLKWIILKFTSSDIDLLTMYIY